MRKFPLNRLEEKTFQTQYEELHGFGTKSFWPDYRTLYSLGADIYYVDYLRWLLETAEFLKSAYKEAISNKSKPKQNIVFDPNYSSYLIHLLVMPDKQRRDLRNEFINRLSKPRTLRDRNALARELASTIQRKHDDQKSTLQFLAKEQGLTWDSESWVASSLDDFMVYLVATYGDLNTLFARQKHGDSFGNFFIFALSEHLREISKDRKPHFNECRSLLDKLRSKKALSKSKNPRRASTNRISQFKRRHPTIKNILPALKKFYPNYLTVMKTANKPK